MSVTAIVVAVEEEYRAIRKRMPRADLGSAGGIAFVRGELGGQSVVLAKSGMGSERAFEAASALIEAHAPKALLVAGFCAGLKEGVAPGDLVIAKCVVAPGIGGERADWQFDTPVSSDRPGYGSVRQGLPDAELCERARAVASGRSGVHLGDLYCAMRVIRTRIEKRQLGSGMAVVAADMESQGAAAAAIRYRIPWLVVRAVTDGVNDDLPLDFERFMDASGEAARGKIAAYVALRPWFAPALIRLGKRSAVAAGNLAGFLEQLLVTP